MQNLESGKKLATFGDSKPRAALLGVLGVIIVVLSTSVITLYKDRNETYQQILNQKDICGEEKLEIIYGAIKKQEEMNERYNRKVAELYDDLNAINKTLRRK